MQNQFLFAKFCQILSKMASSNANLCIFIPHTEMKEEFSINTSTSNQNIHKK